MFADGPAVTFTFGADNTGILELDPEFLAHVNEFGLSPDSEAFISLLSATVPVAGLIVCATNGCSGFDAVMAGLSTVGGLVGGAGQVVKYYRGADDVIDISTQALITNLPISGRKFNQLTSRGWDQTSINNIVNNPKHTSYAINRNTGGSATAYFDNTGNYIVRDDMTGDLVQMSNRNDPDWIPDSSIRDPYIPD